MDYPMDYPMDSMEIQSPDLFQGSVGITATRSAGNPGTSFGPSHIWPDLITSDFYIWDLYDLYTIFI